MDGYGGGGSSAHGSSRLQDLKPFGANSSGAAVFDASQYAFFGNDVVEEVELGGLEDEEDDLAPVGFEEEEFQLEREEGDVSGSLSEIEDLSSTFLKLNKVTSGPTSAGDGRNWESRESSSAAEWVQEPGFANWIDHQRAFEAENIQENKKWSSNPYSAPTHYIEPKLLNRTSSYPEHPQQHPQHPQQQQIQNPHYSSEPILIPKSPFTSYPPPGGNRSSPNGQSSQPNIPHHLGSPNLSPFNNSPLQLNALPQGPQFGGNLPHGQQLQNQWPNQSNLYSGNNRPGLPNNMLHQHQNNGLMPPQMMPPQQARMQQSSSYGHLSGLQSHLLNPHLSPSPPMMNNFEMLGLPPPQDLRDQRAISMMRNRQQQQQGMRYPHQGPDFGNNGWPRFKSKYMSPDEIENILRMQLAATHSNDPYVEDYYHQACLARKSSGAKLRHHFCPSNLRDSASRPRSSNEQHAFLNVDALGRVSFSSIRRPRPLLEVDSSNSSKSSSSGGPHEPKLSEKPLEQEPMLAARVTIEDGILLLLDVDDIDRFLQFNANQLQDGGAQLRQRRQVLLEGLASSLHLVDPLGKNGHGVDLAPEDDFVFLTLLSLPKGRKLLLKYLQVLSPGELARVVCMAVFRNLRFLFGNISEASSVTVNNLGKTVSSLVHSMELKSLAACLASVVCSTEHPPLRPVGSSAGDGASVILKSLLERATEILTDPHAGGNCSPPNRAFWQASFDAFFNLLTKYCFNKYDSVLQSVFAQGSVDPSSIGADVAKAISREMPVELLRASLPHTNEQQRKVLLEFAQRSMAVTGFGGGSGGGS